MKKVVLAALLALGLGAAAPTALHAQTQAKLNAARNQTVMAFLIQSSPEYATLVKSINAAALEKTFAGQGSYTVFAPTNKAFESLPPGQLDFLLKPENIDSLQKILTYHVISGPQTVAEIHEKIKQAGGEYTAPTIGEGGNVTFLVEGNNVVIKDAHGFRSVLLPPVKTTNGIIYRMDKILIP
ncbi:fasciclin domain-containing protein [Taibaiella chishuiensis]|uniref:Putative surface protein with fasciclin (FAS1) repeats n=1 Tax=Taibaiella chishuiensis TaxID=1434707 RepID=A0A2P8CVP0_9BACT|nr:fasciclin domain-containing protein [Taibaiella chishuiensis]PSK89009.1 putative surface protein with fasciclin (FAS1) repeats [Taibaiella chishuiensis]